MSASLLHDSVAPGDTRRRLLLLSYHFPPGGLAGALRWQKLARFAAERGWGLDVVAAHPSELPVVDPARLEALPGGVRVYGVRRPPLLREHPERWLIALARRVRRGGSLAVGDAGTAEGEDPATTAALSRASLRDQLTPTGLVRAWSASLEYAREKRWAREAARVGRGLLASGRHRLVVSCGPPHMAHEGARGLAAAAGLPLVVDLRDPWSLVERLPVEVASPVWLWLARRYERRVVEAAALVVLNTPRALQAMQRAHPTHAERMLAVLNGWDDDTLPACPAPADGCFRIAYLGTVYLDRDPRPFLRAAGRLVRELGLEPRALDIAFMGDATHFGTIRTEELAAAEGLAAHFRVLPARPHDEAMRFLAGAQMLLSLPQDSHMAVPSKVYEYLRFPAWLLALCDAESASAQVLAGTGADVVPPADEEAIYGVLRERFLAHRRGEAPPPLTRDPRFSRRAQAQTLFDAIERVVAG